MTLGKLSRYAEIGIQVGSLRQSPRERAVESRQKQGLCVYRSVWLGREGLLNTLSRSSKKAFK